MCFSDWSFAEEAQAKWDDLFEIMWYSLNYIVNVLAWIWIWFADLAGRFLTNRWVYGEVFGLDALLRKFWNVMKNVANFWLWFYFVYVIFKWLIKQWKESITENFKKIILWILIAWVGIQASRFLTAAVVDVSTITLVAAWSFPSQVISQSKYIEDWVVDNLKEHFSEDGKIAKGLEITLFPNNQASDLLHVEPKDIALNNESKEGLLDKLMPNAENVSGPLHYIWFCILNTYKVPTLKESGPTADEKNRSMKATVFNTLIQGWTTIVYSIEMFVLCVVALVRIVYLRMFIILSPIAVLLWCIEQAWQKIWSDDKSLLSGFTKHINLKSFLINVFKPTIVVLWLGIAMLFASLMQHVVGDSSWKQIHLGGAAISSFADGEPETWKQWDKTYTTTLDNSLLQFTVFTIWKTFLQIILCVMTVLMVYFIISFAVTMWDWKDFMSQKIWDMQKGITWMLWSLPVVPVAWYDKEGAPTTRYMWARNVFDISTWESELLNQKIEQYKWKVDDVYRDQNKIIESWFGENKTNILKSEDKRSIESAWINTTGLGILTAKRNEIRRLGNRAENDGWLPSGYWYGMILNQNASDPFWIQQFTEWLNDRVEEKDYRAASQDWQKMIKDWEWINPTDKSKRDLKTLFDKQNNAKTYANFFGYTSWNYVDFESIKDLDISKKE